MNHAIEPEARHGDLGRTYWRCKVCHRKIEQVARPGAYDRHLASMGHYHSGFMPRTNENFYWRHRAPGRRRALGEPLNYRETR